MKHDVCKLKKMHLLWDGVSTRDFRGSGDEAVGLCGFSRTGSLVRGFRTRVSIDPQRNSSWVASSTNYNFAGRLNKLI